MLAEKNRRIMQDSAWADGLRGIAALYVASSHLVLCFGRHFIVPCCKDDATRTPWLFQRPFLRLIASGHSWVAIFFVLLGFVNALKPIKQARAGSVEAALLGVSTSAFRRSFRLVLPATAATVISWFLCQLGIYERARNSDAFWLYVNTPPPSESWGQALEDLVDAVLATWRLKEDNPYDQPQWALIYLIQGSIMVFFVLFSVLQLNSMWRNIVVGLCLLWSWSWSWQLADPLTGYTVLGGVLMAEFSLTDIPALLAETPLVTHALVPLMTVTALFFMSFPSAMPEGSAWSRNLNIIFTNTFPESTQVEVPRLVGSTGALLLCLAILLSPHLRRALSVPALRWLGRLSFPIYLLHGTVMRSLLAWLVFGGQPTKEFPIGIPGMNPGRKAWRHVQPGTPWTLFCILLSAVALLYASNVWANRLEPVFGKITAWAEDKMKRPSPEGGLFVPPRAGNPTSPRLA